jgi:hypothetical protein
MTITCSIDHDRRTMVAIASGPIGWEEVRSHLLAERFEGGLSYLELIDARAATPTWSSDEARDIVALLTTFGRKSALGPTAVVVSCDLAFGMLRMLEIFIEDICIVKPFRDYDAAGKWLRELEVSRDPTSGTGPRETLHDPASKFFEKVNSEQ